MQSTHMKAIISTGYGSVDVFRLQEVPMPQPAENEILVKIHATAVTAADSMMRKGSPYIGRLYLGLFKPKKVIGGTAFAGEVIQIGQGVKSFQVGMKVFGESIDMVGTYAEYIAIQEDSVLAPIPANISYDEAASVSDGPLTSLNLMRDIANLQAGQRVLIIGASGSLGSAGVQLAKHLGAHVTGVCSGRNVDMVKALGADHVIDYKKEDFTQNNQTYDLIYDSVGKSTFNNAKASLKEKGIYLSPVLSIGMLFQMLFTSLFGKKKIKFAATGMRPKAELKVLLMDLQALLAKGKLDMVIDRRYSLENIAEAHRYVDTGHKKGNVIIKIS